MIRYSDGLDEADIDQLMRLRRRAGFADLPREIVLLQVRGARWVATAWDGGRLVGFARAISDGVTNGYVSTVVVDENYRGRGIGRGVIERLLTGHDSVRFVLHSRGEEKPFYAKLGFTEAQDRLRRDRKRRP